MIAYRYFRNMMAAVLSRYCVHNWMHGKEIASAGGEKNGYELCKWSRQGGDAFTAK
jgi:hypothetical protein